MDSCNRLPFSHVVTDRTGGAVALVLVNSVESIVSNVEKIEVNESLFTPVSLRTSIVNRSIPPAKLAP